MPFRAPATAAYFICRESSPGIRDLAAALAALAPDVEPIIVCDHAAGAADHARERTVANDSCRAAGFAGSVTAADMPEIGGWEKALFLAAGGAHERAWFIEDDVLFRDAAACAALIGAYAPHGADLVSVLHATPQTHPHWFHWSTVQGFFPPASAARSFVALSRLSRRVLDRVAGLARRHGRLCFIESMFASLCAEHGYAVLDIDGRHVEMRWRPLFSAGEAETAFGNGQLAIHPFKANPAPGTFDRALRDLRQVGAAPLPAGP